MPEGKTERTTGMAALSYRNQDSGYCTVGNLSDMQQSPHGLEAGER